MIHRNISTTLCIVEQRRFRVYKKRLSTHNRIALTHATNKVHTLEYSSTHTIRTCIWPPHYVLHDVHTVDTIVTIWLIRTHVLFDLDHKCDKRNGMLSWHRDWTRNVGGRGGLCPMSLYTSWRVCFVWARDRKTTHVDLVLLLYRVYYVHYNTCLLSTCWIVAFVSEWLHNPQYGQCMHENVYECTVTERLHYRKCNRCSCHNTFNSIEQTCNLIHPHIPTHLRAVSSRACICLSRMLNWLHALCCNGDPLT